MQRPMVGRVRRAAPKDRRASLPSRLTCRRASFASVDIAMLASDPNGAVQVTLEVRGEFPEGVRITSKRVISENATQLGFRSKDWE